MTRPQPSHVLAACVVLLTACVGVAALDVSRPGPWIIATVILGIAAAQVVRMRADRVEAPGDAARSTSAG